MRLQPALTACVCVFKQITLVGANQFINFENIIAWSKRTLKTRVATSLYIQRRCAILVGLKNRKPNCFHGISSNKKDKKERNEFSLNLNEYYNCQLFYATMYWMIFKHLIFFISNELQCWSGLPQLELKSLCCTSILINPFQNIANYFYQFAICISSGALSGVFIDGIHSIFRTRIKTFNENWNHLFCHSIINVG